MRRFPEQLQGFSGRISGTDLLHLRVPYSKKIPSGLDKMPRVFRCGASSFEPVDINYPTLLSRPTLVN